MPTQAALDGVTAATNTKALIAAGTAAGVTGTGTWFHFLPDDIGKAGTIISLLTFAALFYFRKRQERRAQEAHELDIEIKKEQLRKLKDDD